LVLVNIYLKRFNISQQRKTKAKLTEGPVDKILIKMTIPMIFGMLGMIAFNLVDTFFVGKIGTNELAALSFTFPIVMTIVSIALGLGIGASAVISGAIGKGDHHKVQRLTTDSLILAFVVVTAFVTAGLLTIDTLFSALGAKPEMIPLIKQYMTIWYIGMPFVVVPMVGNNAIRATGDTKTPSMIMLVAVTVNFIMDPLLIFGIGPFPKLGLQGAAIATVMARAITFTVAFYILSVREKMISFALPKFKEVLQSWKAVLHIGIPEAGSRIIVPISIGIITRILSGFGAAAVAGFGVASRIEFFSLSVVYALCSAFGPFTGQNLGAGKFHRVKEGVKVAEKIALFWGLFIFLLLVSFSAPIATIFNKDPEVIIVIRMYLLIVPISFIFQGFVLITRTALNIMRRPFIAVGLIVTQMLILYIPLAFLGAKLFEVKGVFSATVTAYIVAGTLSLYVLNRVLKKMENSIRVEEKVVEGER
jgi:putative MATE family efflux protein